MTRRMKDSGVEWIGEIPEEWSVVSIKNISNVFGRIGFRGYTVDDLVDEGEGAITLSPTNITNNKLTLDKCTYLSWAKYEESPEIKLYKNDIVFVKTASVGKCAIIDVDNKKITINPQFVVFKNLKLNYKYFYYTLISDIIQKQLNLDLSGGVIKTITQKDLLNYKIPYCNLNKQRKIAIYLDEKCSKIDSTIEKEKQVIEKLKEYKQSVITEAVTKGLNPNVKMKDSGVEWIGEIPEHWQIMKVKHLGTARNGLTYSPNEVCDNDEGILVLRSSNIKDGKLVFDDNVYVNKEVQSDLLVKENDILICSRNGSRKLIGKNAIVNKNIGASFGAFMMIFRCNTNAKYIKYILDSDIFKYYLGTFLTSTINQLTNTNFSNMKLVFCSDVDEQNELVKYLDEKCSSIDRLISNKEKLIEKLTEYKKSLIYECVTGKREVL